MKITKSELKTLIQEEVKRQKTVIELKNRKMAILRQLNEMDYSMEEMPFLPAEDELEEGLFKPSAEELAKIAALEKQFDALVAAGGVGNKAAFLEKAKGDGYNGTLTTSIGKSGGFAGKKIILYAPKLTTLQKLGSAAGNVTGGGGTGEKQAPL